MEKQEKALENGLQNSLTIQSGSNSIGVGQRNKIETFQATQTGAKLKDIALTSIGGVIAEFEIALGIREHMKLAPEELYGISHHIQKNYGTITIAELKKAGDLLLSEELRKSSGETITPSSHFQNMSLAFVCEWLNAYKRYANDAARVVRQLQEPREPIITNLDRLSADVKFLLEFVIPAIQNEKYGISHDETGYVNPFWIMYPEIFQEIEKRTAYEMGNARKWEIYKQAESIIRQHKTGTLAGLVAQLDPLADSDIPASAIKRKAREMACIEAIGHLRAVGVIDLYEEFRIPINQEFTYDNTKVIRQYLSEDMSIVGIEEMGYSIEEIHLSVIE